MRRAVVLVLVGCGSVSQTPDAAPDAGPTSEACTPSAPGSVPADEDGDGEVDEGCAWAFGEPHWLTRSVPANPRLPTSLGLAQDITAISSDGLRVYVSTCQGTAECSITRMSRTGRAAPFEAPTPVTGPGWTDFSVLAVTLSADELELIAAARPLAAAPTGADLYRATRTSRDEAFGALARIDTLSTAGGEASPDLSRDGVELVWDVDGVMFRAVRASATDGFGTPTALTDDGPSLIARIQPGLSTDRRTVFFVGGAASGPARIYVAQRSSPDSTSLTGVTELSALEPSRTASLYRPRLAEGTRELFFTSDRPWSPANFGVWRAQVCRDGACSDETIPCDGGFRSDDGLHCYRRQAGPLGFADAEAACVAAGGHLASIHSAAENDLVFTAFAQGQGNVWIGGFDNTPAVPECNTGMQQKGELRCAWGWTSGEGWFFSPWQGTNPNNANGGEHGAKINQGDAGQWSDQVTSGAGPFVCETVLYPTW